MSSVFFGVATRTFHYDKTIGRGEFNGTGFRSAMDLALAPSGTIYVINRSYEYRPDGVRVTMLNIDEDYLGEFSKFGEADGDLFWPSSVAVDKDEKVYISDDWLNRISIFDKDGDYLGKWGTPGSGDGEINRPSGIRFDKDDNLYMVDSSNNRVQVFTKDGKFLSKWGEEGSGEGQFNLPWGLTIDGNGDVYVADWRNDRVQKFSPNGEYLAEFGSGVHGKPFVYYTAEAAELNPSVGEVGEFKRPTGVAVDKDGDIYVADWGNDRVQVLTQEGRHITSFSGDASLSKWGKEKVAASPDMIRQRNLMRDMSPERHLWRPKQIAVDGEGRIIILDSMRDRLQVYQKDNY